MIQKDKIIPTVVLVFVFSLSIFIANNKDNEKNPPSQIFTQKTNANISVKTEQKEPTKIEDSLYNTLHPSNYMDYMRTSEGLTKADLAWHATNTYGWNCSEVKIKSSNIKTTGKEFGKDPIRKEINGFYYFITCSNNKKYRVYPRADYYPIITNAQGGFN